ncbi:MAG: hypothetical protein AAFO72_11720 [Pseudomonadota bacterium]
MAYPVFVPGQPGLIPDAWVINPGGTGSAPPVVAVHGIRRAVEQMAHLLTPRAQETGRTIVLPHFDKTQWPRYQRAACAQRADTALLNLVQRLTVEGVMNPGPFDLSGFSGGAQFAHRFAWMYPSRVGRLCATSPGWWTFPDAQAAWPYGTGTKPSRRSLQSGWLQANLGRFLSREIVVSVGSNDITRDHNLRQGQFIDAQQGRNRHERAQNWVDAMRYAARCLGVESNICFTELKGQGHSFSRCVQRAHLDHLFVSPPNPCAGCQQRHACSKSQFSKLLERNAA